MSVMERFAAFLQSVASHREERSLDEIVIYPEHEDRKESAEFRKAKKKLKEDGHYECWVCGSKLGLEAHHFACEWALANACDYDKLKEVLELFDIYGYSAGMKDMPITSVDDVRNMLVLCKHHHTHKVNGIHSCSFPIWIIQKVAKDGENPVPQLLKRQKTPRRYDQ